MVKCPPYTEKLAEFVDRIATAQIITAEAGMLLCAVRGPSLACLLGRVEVQLSK